MNDPRAILMLIAAVAFLVIAIFMMYCAMRRQARAHKQLKSDHNDTVCAVNKIHNLMPYEGSFMTFKRVPAASKNDVAALPLLLKHLNLELHTTASKSKLRKKKK